MRHTIIQWLPRRRMRPPTRDPPVTLDPAPAEFAPADAGSDGTAQGAMVPGCKYGYAFGSAVPANRSDPLLRNWTKSGRAIVNDTFDDPSTAWKTSTGEAAGGSACMHTHADACTRMHIRGLIMRARRGGRAWVIAGLQDCTIAGSQDFKRDCMIGSCLAPAWLLIDSCLAPDWLLIGS